MKEKTNTDHTEKSRYLPSKKLISIVEHSNAFIRKMLGKKDFFF